RCTRRGRSRLYPTRSSRRPRPRAAAFAGEARGVAARDPGAAAGVAEIAGVARCAARAAARPDGGGRLWIVAAAEDPRHPGTWLLERACVAAAALAWRRADPARHRSRRHRDRRVPDAD